MENKLVLSYSPEQIDEAVKEHIRTTTSYTGDFEIAYTHKRTLKKVSAEITLSEPVRISQKSQIPEASTLNNETGEFEASSVTKEDILNSVPLPELEGTGKEEYVDTYETGENTIGEAVANVIAIDGSITFDDLPEHEQEEAMCTQEGVEGKVDELEDIVEHMSTTDELDEELRTESREADSELEIPEGTPEEISDTDEDNLESLFPTS